MKITKEIPTTRRVVEAVICDVCKNKVEKEYAEEVAEVELGYRSGVQYWDEGHGVYAQYDVCKKCFLEKIQPFLESLGAKPTITDWES